MLRTWVGQVGGQQVDVVGQVLPGAGDARHLRLAAQLAFGADLARHARHFAGEAVQLIDHRVDGLLQLQDLAAHVDGDLLRQVAAAPPRWSLRRCCAPGPVRLLAIELTLSVRSFQVPATPRHLAWPPSLPSVPTSRATRVTSPAKRVQLVDHRVDGLLQLQDLAAHVDGDLLRQVAVGDGGRDLGDVADLGGQVARHRVDVVGQVLPGAGDAEHLAPGRRACPRCRPRAPRASPRRRRRSAGRPSC